MSSDDSLVGKTSEDSKNTDDIDEKISKWSEKVQEKYNNLHNVVLDTLPDLWIPLEFALSVKTVLNIKGCSLPFAGILLGPPGSLKTAVIQLFRDCKCKLSVCQCHCSAAIVIECNIGRSFLSDCHPSKFYAPPLSVFPVLVHL